MSKLPFRAGKVVLRRQTLLGATISRDEEASGVEWTLGVAKAPDSVETDEPIGVMTDLTIHTGENFLQATFLSMIGLPKGVCRADIDVADMRGVVIRQFNAVLWHTAVTAIRQLAALGATGLINIPIAPPEPAVIDLTPVPEE